MKILLLLRHAKSSWKDESLPDFERPLSKRGLRDATRIGQLLNEENLLHDLILSSSSRRTRHTVELATEAGGYIGEVHWLDELYAAPPENYLDALWGLPDTYGCVMVVGHNPGLEELLDLLTGEEEGMSTACLAQINLPIQSWREMSMETQGKLINIWRPKEL